MKDGSKYVGLDVHKETIAVSIADAHGGEVRYFGEIKNSTEAIHKLCNKIKAKQGGLFFCYEPALVSLGSIGSSSIWAGTVLRLGPKSKLPIDAGFHEPMTLTGPMLKTHS